MATSSIFSNVVIRNQKQAETFIDALEKSGRDPKRVPTSQVNPPLRDREAIRSLFKERLNNK